MLQIGQPIKLGEQYACPFCSISMNRTNMEKHIRVHTGEKPFACPYCNYSSTQKGNCDRHMKRCHPEFLAEISMSVTDPQESAKKEKPL